MDGEEASPNIIIAKLVEMGFEYSSAKEAVQSVGLSISEAANYILNGARGNSQDAATGSKCCTVNKKALGKRASSFSNPSEKMRQSSILDHFQLKSPTKRNKTNVVIDMPISVTNCSSCPLEACPGVFDNVHQHTESTSDLASVRCPAEMEIGPDWEQTVKILLQKRFGYSLLKSFQKEALVSWIAQKDCLVLAATGSGNIYLFMFIEVLIGPL